MEDLFCTELSNTQLNRLQVTPAGSGTDCCVFLSQSTDQWKFNGCTPVGSSTWNQEPTGPALPVITSTVLGLLFFTFIYRTLPIGCSKNVCKTTRRKLSDSSVYLCSNCIFRQTFQVLSCTMYNKKYGLFMVFYE